ncbi:hypothetical protein GCM10010307_70260 [Streptomyces vastus]|uniref:Fumarylacetoacetase-like C-terminal domain-containing protein n=1 Tax=Streptomyces vastus TaxID=285451 RepID=A0ABP6DZW1_9ACTN
MQDGHTRDLIHPDTALIIRLCQIVTFLPSDVTLTGTPAASAMGHNSLRYLALGDAQDPRDRPDGRRTASLLLGSFSLGAISWAVYWPFPGRMHACHRPRRSPHRPRPCRGGSIPMLPTASECENEPARATRT